LLVVEVVVQVYQEQVEVVVEVVELEDIDLLVMVLVHYKVQV
jgi:hypothetical protein